MTQQVEEGARAERARLLVVEDEPEIQAVLQDLCSLAGYDCLVASTGAAGLDLLEHESVDLVILDVMLPDMNGYDICQQVRHSTLAQIPILMLTALSQPPDVAQGLEVGADDYMKKPFEPAELMLRIKGLLRRYAESRTMEQDAATLRNTLDLVQRQLSVTQSAYQTEASLRFEFLHNVTTHMQALYGIVDAALRRLPPSAERDAVQQIKSRVRGAALVYEVSEALQVDPVDIGSVIRTIATALKSMYRPWKRVTLTVKGDMLDLPAVLASPIAMIVNELVTNCFKHAFPDNRFGTVEVSYALSDGAFLLDVRDNGAGFDEAQSSGGRGRPTIKQLVEGLQGTATWNTGNAGTHARIAVPLHALADMHVDQAQTAPTMS
jgi:DNA-binding response OmpR family regulator/anti-sigma regulatory factor (Ser/Thr protein kinase)